MRDGDQGLGHPLRLVLHCEPPGAAGHRCAVLRGERGAALHQAGARVRVKRFVAGTALAGAVVPRHAQILRALRVGEVVTVPVRNARVLCKVKA